VAGGKLKVDQTPALAKAVATEARRVLIAAIIPPVMLVRHKVG